MKPSDSTVDAIVPRRRNAVPLLLILALGLLVRTIDLGWGLPTTDRLCGYQIDELTFFSMAGNLRPQKLQFHPGEMRLPPFTAYVYAASLVLGKVVGYVELKTDKLYYREHPDQLAHMILVGRIQSVFFSLLGIWMIYLLVGALAPDLPDWVPLLAALLLAILPGHVAWCRYLSQYPPLMVWWLTGLWLLVRFTQQPSTRRLALAAVPFGGALATAFNSVAVMPVLVIAPWLVRGGGEERLTPGRRVAWSALALAVSGATMVLFHPYSVLDFHGFMGGLSFASGFGNVSRIPRIVQFGYWLTNIIPHGVGWGIWLAGLLGVGYAVVRRPGPGEWLVLIAVALQLGIGFKLGHRATSSRMLLLHVLWPVFAALLIGRLAVQPRRRVGAWVLGVFAVAWSLFQVGWMLAAWETDTVRRDASDWIKANLPDTATIGTVEKQAYWASPDIVASKDAYPALVHRDWTFKQYEFKARRLADEPTEFIVTTDHEMNYRRRRNNEPTKDEFVDVLHRDYEPIATFTQQVPAPPLLPHFREFGNNLWMPTEVVVYRHRDASR